MEIERIELITRKSLEAAINGVNSSIDEKISNKQNVISVGDGLHLSEDNVLSINTDDLYKYKSGDNIFIDSDHRIHARFVLPPPDDVPNSEVPPNPPLPIMNFSASIESDQVVLRWELPKDDNVTGVRIIKNNNKIPSSLEDGYGVYEGKGETFIDTDLNEAKKIYYRAFTFNKNKVINPDASQVAMATIKKPQEKPPVPVVTDISSTSVFLQSIPNGEYKINNGVWQPSPIFNGLNSLTTYNVYQRYAETENLYASEISDATEFQTTSSSTYTVIIDTEDSNPESCCKYADDAINFKPNDPMFDKLIGYYPCILKNGVEVKKLNPMDYSKTIDGETADITSGDEGDVMIAFPLHGYKIEYKGTELHVSITNDPNRKGFCYEPFIDEGVKKNVLYYSAYPGTQKNGKLASVSNITSSHLSNTAMDSTDQILKINSPKYRIMNWYHVTFLQCLCIIRFKRLDIKTIVGTDTNYYYYNSGRYDTMGLNINSTHEGHSNKVLGMEYIFGGYQLLIEGVFLRSDKFYVTNKRITNRIGYMPTSDDLDNYKYSKSINMGYLSSSYISKVIGNNDFGFLPDTPGKSDSSDTKYFSSSVNMQSADTQFHLVGYHDNRENNIFSLHSFSENAAGWCRFVCQL